MKAAFNSYAYYHILQEIGYIMKKNKYTYKDCKGLYFENIDSPHFK